jgi:hypothetical protein
LAAEELHLVQILLQQMAIEGHQIGQNAVEENQKAQNQQRAANHHRLHVPPDAGLIGEVQVEEADNGPGANQNEGQADVKKGFERLVQGVQPQQSGPGAPDVAPGAAHQPGLAGFFAGLDGDVGNRQLFFAGLDNGFQGVGVLAEDIEAQGGLSGEGAEAAGGVGNLGAGDKAHGHAAGGLQRFFQRREMLDGVGLAVADDHIGLPGQNGGDELRDLPAGVLVIAIGVDNDVGPQFEAGIQPGLKGFGQPLVADVPNNVIDPQPAGHLHGAVGGTVIDNQHRHRFDAGNGAGQIGQGEGQSVFFIKTGNLDNEFHGAGIDRDSWCRRMALSGTGWPFWAAMARWPVAKSYMPMSRV